MAIENIDASQCIEHGEIHLQVHCNEDINQLSPLASGHISLSDHCQKCGSLHKSTEMHYVLMLPIILRSLIVKLYHFLNQLIALNQMIMWNFTYRE